jgi:predicted phosphodiesterase
MNHQGEAGSIIFLGDNVYPRGLPPKGHRLYAASEQRLKTQLHLLRPYQGRVIYLSGNHDWNKGRSDGYSYMLRQQDYVQSFLEKQNSYLPLDGCPGPVSFSLAPGLRLIVINTQWWVQRGIRPIGKAYGCTVETVDEFFQQLQKLLDNHQDEQIIIAAHHPLYSNAMHGGKFTVKQHVFPLTAAHKKFYLPLPVAGSVYPAYRKYFGAYEDMSHPRYRRLRKRLLKLFHKYQNIIYVAGHDHNLQYFLVKGNHYIVSGSGSKTAFVKKGGRAAFTHEHKGFFVIDYYQNKQVWLRALEPVTQGQNQPEVIFQRRLK